MIYNMGDTQINDKHQKITCVPRVSTACPGQLRTKGKKQIEECPGQNDDVIDPCVQHHDLTAIAQSYEKIN